MQYSINLPKYVSSSNYIFGLAEKPSAAERIAKTLDPKSKKFSIKVKRGSKKLQSINGHFVKYNEDIIIIIPALGHLFTLVKDGYGWQYPMYNFKWVPIYEATSKYDQRFKDRVEATIEVIRKLAKKANKCIVMTDYDEEGEVIGALTLSILVSDKILNNVQRLKISSFAKDELITAFNNVKNTGINFGMYNRGLMRHYLDWLWGINMSKALVISLKNYSHEYHTLSTGRVQGPTLSFVARRQVEINTFVPIPRFKINVEINGIAVNYQNTFIREEKTAKNIIKQIKGKNAQITKITSNTKKIPPPTPYNLSSLQRDAYKFFKLSPSRTLKAAENLYLSALISYPRTSSEKYPPNTNHKKILKQLKKITEYSGLISLIKRYKPAEGKKTDPAHPCIYPTGEIPKKLTGDSKKIYELIVIRYVSTFGTIAEIQNSRIEFSVNSHLFYLSGKTIIKPGWYSLLGKFNTFEELKLPKLEENTSLPVTSAKYRLMFTTPPARYNQASLLREMEDNDIGTKATRSEIISNIIDRKYIHGDPLEITSVGLIVNDVLSRYCPQVISVELSRELEHMGDYLESSENDFTLSDAIIWGIMYLHNNLLQLKQNEMEVGRLISQGLKSTRKFSETVGICPVCNKGSLKIIKNPATGKRFVGCSGYFDGSCTATFAIPLKGRIYPTNKLCKFDNYPQIRVLSGKKPWYFCLNPKCPSKENYTKKERKK